MPLNPLSIPFVPGTPADVPKPADPPIEVPTSTEPGEEADDAVDDSREDAEEVEEALAGLGVQHPPDEEEEDDDEAFVYPGPTAKIKEEDKLPAAALIDDPLAQPVESSSALERTMAEQQPATSSTSPSAPTSDDPLSSSSLLPAVVERAAQLALVRQPVIEPEEDLSPAIIAAITSNQLHLIRRAFESSRQSAFTLSNAPLSPHTLLTPLHLAASLGYLSIVQFLIAEGGAVSGMEDAEGETALHKAAFKGHLAVVTHLVQDAQVNPHARDKEGFTALHNACSKGFLDVVRFLCMNSSAAGYDPEESLEGGAGRVRGVDRRSKGGWTPLMCACADGHLPVVLYLIAKQSADPLVRNNFGETAYDISAGVFEVHICDALEHFESERWPSLSVPRAEPYNLLAVHSSVPILVFENQRLDSRIKTLATTGGHPRFTSSGLGKKGRRSPWELRLPTGSRAHAHDNGAAGGAEPAWEGVVPCGKGDVELPLIERPFVLPLPKTEDLADKERSHFWLSEMAIDLSNPKSDVNDGWSYAPSFSSPPEAWTAQPPPALERLLSGSSLVVPALLGGSGSDSSAETIREQGSATWVRRRVWVRIMRRRFDIPPLPSLEPDGMSLAGYAGDGSKGKPGLSPGGRDFGFLRRQEGGDQEEGEEMGSFPTSYLSGTSSATARGGESGESDGDYLPRAEYFAGGKQGSRIREGDAASLRNVIGSEEREETPAEMRRRLGKLERAIGGLRHGLITEYDDARKTRASTLLTQLSRELDQLQTAFESLRLTPGVSYSSDSDSESSEFVYPGASPSLSSAGASTSPRPPSMARASSRSSRAESASTNYFHLAGSGGAAPDMSPQLNVSETFRVPTAESGLKIRRSPGGILSPVLARAEWERDEAAPDCRRCHRRFTFFLRKHHCRRCGRIFCDACSSHRTRLAAAEIVLDPAMPFSQLSDELEAAHRVCEPCFAEAAAPSLGGRGLEGSVGSLNGGGSGSGDAGSVSSELAECPVCQKNLAAFGNQAEQEAHVRTCLEDGGASVQAGRYLVYVLGPESSLVGVECVICLEEFTPLTRIARLNCLCSFHDPCLSAWLSRGRSCPVHARET